MRKQKYIWAVQIFFIAALMFIVVCPALAMFAKIATADISGVVSSARFKSSLLHSAAAASLTTAISVLLAGILAFCVVRTHMPFRKLFTVIFILPMLMPSVSHGTGLIVLYGANGVITRILGLDSSIYGFWGIVMGSVMYSFPFAFLMIQDILAYQDATPYLAAETLNISKFRQFKLITMPYMYKPMISVIFTVFTIVVTDYGVPLMIGGRYTTLPVMMYQDVIEQQNFSTGSLIGLALLTPAIIAFVVDIISKDKTNKGALYNPLVVSAKKTRDWLAFTFSSVISFIAVLPIIAFSILAFVKKYPINMSLTLDHLRYIFKINAAQYLLNSLTISFLSALLGVSIIFILAYLVVRTPSKLSRWLHIFATIPLAIPGIVLGLAYIIFFKGSIIYNTIGILVLVNFVHFFTSPYLIVCNALGKIDLDIEDVGAIMGVRRIPIILHIILPQLKATIVEAFAQIFINSMMTISAVSFLSTNATKPFALLLPALEKNSLIEEIAAVSLIILLVNLLLRASVEITKYFFRKRMSLS